jgi:hypothetical protein
MRLLSALLSLALGLAAWPAAAQQPPVIVELFTSQSCSSCPPADALLTELSATHRDILALDLHVTYWDQLGWKDPYSLDAATARQHAYADLFRSHEVYTPQIVIDGRRQAVGSDRHAVLAAIEAAKADAGSATPIPLDLAVDGNRLAISAGAGRGTATLLLVGFDARHTTPVRGGENGGRTLSEVNVVRSLATVAQWNGQRLSLTVDRPAGERAVVLLQAPDGHFLAAAILPLSS